MKSNYKNLGPYIDFIDSRALNHEAILDLDSIRGISSISKDFIKTRANLVGVVADKYKVVESNFFAYNPNTARMGDKIPIALNQFDYPVLVSSIYPTFKINNTNELHPEYLMMWFQRPEFDRYARFMSHGSAREVFDIDEMNGIMLPIPPITKQREIVKEYTVIQNRIALNQQFIQKLEETAQAIYKQWFVDFEFPDKNGKPYKSNGGEMVWNEELQKEIPKGWEVDDLQKLILFKNGKSKPTKKGTNPVYGGNGIIEYVDNHNDENVIAIGRVGAYCGSLYRVLGKCWISDNAISAQSKINANMFSYYVLNDLNLNERSEGTGQPLITQGLLNGIRITIPEKHIINRFEIVAITTFKNQDGISQENQKLTELKNLLLSKLATIEN